MHGSTASAIPCANAVRSFGGQLVTALDEPSCDTTVHRREGSQGDTTGGPTIDRMTCYSNPHPPARAPDTLLLVLYEQNEMDKNVLLLEFPKRHLYLERVTIFVLAIANGDVHSSDVVNNVYLTL